MNFALVKKMIEQVPDRPDWDEYDAERERIHRHNIKMARRYERAEQEAERKREENEEDEFI